MSADQNPPQDTQDPAGGRAWLRARDMAALMRIPEGTLRRRLREEESAGVPEGERTVPSPDWPPPGERGSGVQMLWRPERADEIRPVRPPDDPALLTGGAPDDLWCGPKMTMALFGWAPGTFYSARSERRRAMLPPADEMSGPHPYWRLGTLRAFRAGRSVSARDNET